jgi:2-polyprenyl-3-methyl-5-hydroxy-6-metoxy-1,4-benzoquinol methylase
MLIEELIKKKTQRNTIGVGSDTTQDQLQNYQHRLNYIRLKWCKQVKNILNSNYKFSSKLKINDIGCGFVPFYKELKLSKLKFNYRGYDYDNSALEAAKKKFPELKKKLFLTNVTNCSNIRKADVTIVSSLLEHIDCPIKVLNYLISKTKKCLILRIPLSDRNLVKIIKIKNKDQSYIFSTFKKKEILDILKINQFTPGFHKNLSSSLKTMINYKGRKERIGTTKELIRLKRRITIIEATKNK